MDPTTARGKRRKSHEPACGARSRAPQAPARPETGTAGQGSALALDLSTATQALIGYGLLRSNPADPLVIDLPETAMPLAEIEIDEARPGDDM